jgi:hypothetical protein
MAIYRIGRVGEGDATRTAWTRIGTAVQNRDGSFRVELDAASADASSSPARLTRRRRTR